MRYFIYESKGKVYTFFFNASNKIQTHLAYLLLAKAEKVWEVGDC